MDPRPIGQYLVAERRIKPSDLEKALRIQAGRGGQTPKPRLGVILFQMGVVDPQDLAMALIKQKRDRVCSNG